MWRCECDQFEALILFINYRLDSVQLSLNLKSIFKKTKCYMMYSLSRVQNKFAEKEFPVIIVRSTLPALHMHSSNKTVKLTAKRFCSFETCMYASWRRHMMYESHCISVHLHFCCLLHKIKIASEINIMVHIRWWWKRSKLSWYANKIPHYKWRFLGDLHIIDHQIYLFGWCWLVCQP